MLKPSQPPQRPDTKKMGFEQLQAYLERELPYFGFSIHHFGRDMPVNLSYRHQHRGLAEYGTRFPFGSLGGTYATPTAALKHVADRYHALLDEGLKASAAAAEQKEHRDIIARSSRQAPKRVEPAEPVSAKMAPPEAPTQAPSPPVDGSQGKQ